jgi:hypothetical protein
MLWKKIKELIRYLPASILTTLAMVLDPGYRSMHERFRSCSPANKHIRSLDFKALQIFTEYGWGIPVGGRGSLVQGTLGGNVPKGGKFANVLYSFPADLYTGFNIVPFMPFILFNPSFGMAFVKLANYIIGSLNLGGAFSGGIESPCYSADVSADAGLELFNGENGYGHPLLLFGPLAMAINSSSYLRLPEDDPEAQIKLCTQLPPVQRDASGNAIAPNVQTDQNIGDNCAED